MDGITTPSRTEYTKPAELHKRKNRVTRRRAVPHNRIDRQTGATKRKRFEGAKSADLYQRQIRWLLVGLFGWKRIVVRKFL
jgi:hypothetical protein